jgi:choloylglycine hydrolase
MKKMILLLISLVIGSVSAGYACTIFAIDNNGVQLIAKNYDYFAEDGLIVINNREVVKVAYDYFGQKAKNPATWVSKYGSVTFDPNGVGLPIGGMNERGLIVEGLFLLGAEYPSPDDRPSISQLQWTQYQLDNFATVKEVLEHVSDVRIRPTIGAPGFHYFIRDRIGKTAVIDWFMGKAEVTTEKDMVVPLMTNSFYKTSIEIWKSKAFPNQDQFQSLQRFSKTADQLLSIKANDKSSMIHYALKVLDSVPWEAPTQWQLIYDPFNLTIHFKTRLNEDLRKLDLNDMDFICAKGIFMMDVNTPGTGNIYEQMRPYDHEINIKMIRNAFLKAPFMKKAPPQIVLQRAKYPDSWRCSD